MYLAFIIFWKWFKHTKVVRPEEASLSAADEDGRGTLPIAEPLVVPKTEMAENEGTQEEVVESTNR
jgi:hypothetical protein